MAEQRREHPELGVRKLHYLIQNELRVGRDAMFDLLREHRLLVRRKRKYARTTDSKHGLRTYRNLLQGQELTAPHQAWVADITYLSTRSGFRYLALITDAYSRKIVGWDLSESLSIEGSMRALKRAYRQLPDGCYPIHHSDRGVQYCSGTYVKRLRRWKLPISMAAVGDPYENAIAERINGILKLEYHLDVTFADEQTARQAVEQAVHRYNISRPHLALCYRTPGEVHASDQYRSAA